MKNINAPDKVKFKMSYNSMGKILKLTTWEKARGRNWAVLDGVPSNIKITESYVQKFLDMRTWKF